MALVDRIAKVARAETTVIPGAMTDIPKPKPFEEIGVSGVLRTKGVGYLFEEWLAQLSTHRAKQVYREMRDNDAVIGSMFFALEMILRRAEWHVEPAANIRESKKYVEFVESCLEDMSHTWQDFIAECVNMFAFGFSLFETVYKRRQGQDGRKTSRFKDGLIGWRKMSPRAQESILYWIWDDSGGLQGCVQLAAPDYRSISIPIEKLLLFRTTSIKNSPEGRSLLRNCFRSWYMKRRTEEIEGIGIERDLCGIPVLSATAEALAMMGGQNAANQIVTRIRLDDMAGVVLPLAYDEQGNPQVKLELLKSGGSKQMDPNATIARYNQDMLNTVLAGFVQFGQSPSGSRSLHMSATQIFSLALSAFMESIAAVMNRIAIPRLFALNGINLELCPRLVAGEIGVRDLEELSSFVQKLSAAGLTFFDHDTVNYLRKAARLPKEPEGDESGPRPQPGAPGQPPVAAPGQPPAPQPPVAAPKKTPAAAPVNANVGNQKDRLDRAV